MNSSPVIKQGDEPTSMITNMNILRSTKNSRSASPRSTFFGERSNSSNSSNDYDAVESLKEEYATVNSESVSTEQILNQNSIMQEF